MGVIGPSHPGIAIEFLLFSGVVLVLSFCWNAMITMIQRRENIHMFPFFPDAMKDVVPTVTILQSPWSQTGACGSSGIAACIASVSAGIPDLCLGRKYQEVNYFEYLQQIGPFSRISARMHA